MWKIAWLFVLRVGGLSPVVHSCKPILWRVEEASPFCYLCYT